MKATSSEEPAPIGCAQVAKVLGAIGLVFVVVIWILMAIKDQSRVPVVSYSDMTPEQRAAVDLAASVARRAEAPPPAQAAPPDDLPTAAAPDVPQDRVTKAEAAAILAELHAFEKVGHEMAGNRYKGDLATATQGDMLGQRRCIDAMRDARPRLAKIQARTTALPDGVISIGLSTAELGACLVCVKSADEACARARTALRDADRELARARW